MSLATCRELPRYVELGARVHRAWKREGLSPSVFTQVAERELMSVAAEPPTVDEVVRWVCSDAVMPRQSEVGRTFSTVPVTVFDGPHFYIQLLFWEQGIPAIHQHAFAGAFTVLQGSSVHATYRFEDARPLGQSSRIGSVELEAVSVLRPGEVRPIVGGPSFIHSTFHLERPTVTLVVRTHGSRAHLPQYNYHPPYLAIDAFQSDELADRQLRMLGMYSTIDVSMFMALAQQLLPHADPTVIYGLWELVLRTRQPSDVVEALRASARAVLGSDADRLWQCARVARRCHVISVLRTRLRDPDVRLFLALLTLPNRRAILGAIEQLYPGCDPVELVLRGTEQTCAAYDVKLRFDAAMRSFFEESLREQDLSRSNDPSFGTLLGRLREHELFAPMFA